MFECEWQQFAEQFGNEEADERQYLSPPPVLETGFGELDGHLCGGMRPGLHVLMAPPGLGKSALALQISLNVATAGGRVLVASIELTRQQCLARLSSCLSATPGTGLQPVSWPGWERGGRQTSREVYAAQRRAGEREGLDVLSADPRIRAMRKLREVAPGLAIADGHAIADCTTLAATARKGRAAGMRLLVIDYLQRLRPPQGLDAADTVRRTSETTQALTELSKRLQIPFLVVSAIGRESAKSGKPSLFAAKGSGDIEFDAQSVWQLTRTGEVADDGTRGLALHVLKARVGTETGEEPIQLGYDGAHGRYEEWR